MATRSLPDASLAVWCAFDGTGTIAIDDSLNMTSLTDIATGIYRLNFSITMGNANYFISAHSADEVGSDVFMVWEDGFSTGRTTTSCEVGCWGLFVANAYDDNDQMMVSVMGDVAAGTDRDLPQATAQVWVMHADATGTPTVGDSHNLTSITDNDPGDFAYNFAITMGANYITQWGSDDNAATPTLVYPFESTASARTTTKCTGLFYDISSGPIDLPIQSLAVYGDVASGTDMDLARGSAAAWGVADNAGTATLLDSYNVTSITDDAVGEITFNLAITMSASDEYAVIVGSDGVEGSFLPFSCETPEVTARSTTAFGVGIYDASIALTDTNYISVAVYGDYT